MLCDKHKYMMCCHSLMESKCECCGETFMNFNAPPVNKLCKECSETHQLCELCGEEIE